jgi:hypothetical protein
MKTINFQVKTGPGKARDGTVNRKGGVCIVCNTPVPFEHIRSEGKAKRMKQQLMAIVLEGNKKRLYISPIEEHIKSAFDASALSIETLLINYGCWVLGFGFWVVNLFNPTPKTHNP